jgi:hypothetical protein
MLLSRHSRSFVLLLLLGTVLVGVLPRKAGAEEEATQSLRETLARTGVFFRADAPFVLRNPTDPYLPIYLEIINGVERTGGSVLRKAAPYIRRDPLRLEGVNIYAKPPGRQRNFASQPLLLGEGQQYSFDARTNGEPLLVESRLKKTLQVPLPLLTDYLRKNFLGGGSDIVDLWVAFRVTGWPSQDIYLRVRLNAPPLPRLANWYRGDMHYHTAYTDNPAERGHPLPVTKQVAIQTGLDWVVLADHSTDLDAERYAKALREVAALRDGRFVYIRGEEVTVVSSKEGLLGTVHLVALPPPENPDRGVAQADSDSVLMTGDGSLASPAMPLKEALATIHAAGAFAYAAHPFDPISPLLRGGSWDLDSDFLAVGGKQLQPGLVGLEPWNRATRVTADNARDPYCLRRDADLNACFQPDPEADQYARLERGIELGWRPLLLKGLAATQPGAAAPAFKAFLAAGSDAHGDFNYEATMDAVDFSKPSRGLSGYAEDNALGKIATVVHCPAGMGPRGENVLQALRDGHSVASNGPLLIAGFDTNSNASLDDPEDVVVGGEISSPLDDLPPLELQWSSSKEFGPLASIRMIVGSAKGESPPVEVPVREGKELGSAGLQPVGLRPYLKGGVGSWMYVRLEARTRNGAGEEFRCYTNPVWVKIREQ